MIKILSIILGTRPEIIKMSPVIKECKRRKLDYFVLHTGQHYSSNMDKVFFQKLDLPKPEYNLDVGSGTHAEQTANMLKGIESVLRKEEPDSVLVEGDTNTVLAGGVAASKLDVEVGHVEAGLRSGDRKMPEETNRILTDHCSDYLFAPTEEAKKNLTEEGIDNKKIFVTGNTIVDAVGRNKKIAEREGNKISPGEHFLVTAHRQENVDAFERFKGIIKGLKLVSEEFNRRIIYPIHPRAKKRLEEFELEIDGIELVEPLDYLSFLKLEAEADLVLTDSGGVQEETCILGVPCVTLRDSTERPETLEVGSNTLAGTDPEAILKNAEKMLDKETEWRNPFGDGRAAERIVGVLEEEYA